VRPRTGALLSVASTTSRPLAPIRRSDDAIAGYDAPYPDIGVGYRVSVRRTIRGSATCFFAPVQQTVTIART